MLLVQKINDKKDTTGKTCHDQKQNFCFSRCIDIYLSLGLGVIDLTIEDYRSIYPMALIGDVKSRWDQDRLILRTNGRVVIDTGVDES